MRHRTILLLVCLAAVGGFHFGSGVNQSVLAQSPTARCTAKVPRDWGEFRGATEQGYTFEDQQGTIRIIRELPCPGLGTPQIAIELRRE